MESFKILRFVYIRFLFWESFQGYIVVEILQLVDLNDASPENLEVVYRPYTSNS